MRGSIVGALWKKEMLDILRDRRTLLLMVLLPLMLYPVIGIIMSQATVAQKKKLQRSRITLGLSGRPLPVHTLQALMKEADIRHLPPKTNWRELLREKKLSLILHVSDPSERERASNAPTSRSASLAALPTTQPLQGLQAGEMKKPRVGEGGRTETAETQAVRKAARAIAQQIPPSLLFQLRYLSTWDASKHAQRRILDALEEHHKRALDERLRGFALPPALIQIYTLKGEDSASPEQRFRHILGGILPWLIVMMTVMGAFYPAIDLTAGEKERGTLETLLTAPITPTEIVAGKYLTVCCIALVAGLLNVLSLSFTMRQALRLAPTPKGATPLHLSFSWGEIALLLGFLFLVAALSSALMMMVASFARSFKEAQNYVTPVYIACFMPGMVSMLPGFTATPVTAFIPLVNVSYALKSLVQGDLSVSYTLTTFLSMGIVSVIFVRLAAMIYQKEQVLFREGDLSWRGLFLPQGTARQRLPGVSDSAILLSVQLLLLFYLGIQMQKTAIAWGLAFTLWVIFLLPPLIWVLVRRMDLRETFQLNPMPLKYLPAIFLLSVSALPLLLFGTEFFSRWMFPNWLEITREMERFFRPERMELSAGLFFFLIAISPAICEEMVFRGFVQTSMRTQFRPWVAIFLAALLFGAFHLSIYRLFPTVALGCLFGWLCWRMGSIYAAMLAHAFNNALAVCLSLYFPKLLSAIAASTAYLVTTLVISALVFALSLRWIVRETRAS